MPGEMECPHPVFYATTRKSKTVSEPAQSLITSKIETITTENTSKCPITAQVSETITSRPSIEGSSPSGNLCTSGSRDLARVEESSGRPDGEPSAHKLENHTIEVVTALCSPLNNDVMVDGTPTPSKTSSSQGLQMTDNNAVMVDRKPTPNKTSPSLGLQITDNNAVEKFSSSNTTHSNCNISSQQSLFNDTQSSDTIAMRNHRLENVGNIQNNPTKSSVVHDNSGENLDDAVKHQHNTTNSEPHDSLINNSPDSSYSQQGIVATREAPAKLSKRSTDEDVQNFTSSGEPKDRQDSMGDGSNRLPVSVQSEKLEDLQKDSHFSDVFRPPQQPIIPC